MTRKEEFLARFPKMPDFPDHHYDITGAPISFAEWAWRFEDKNYQIVQQDKKRGILVSTVWLGLDHSFSWPRGEDPVIFETMIFGGRFSEDWNEWQVRYRTLDAAIRGHRIACRVAFGWRSRLREGLRAWKPQIVMPPVWRWAPPDSWEKPWERSVTTEGGENGNLPR